MKRNLLFILLLFIIPSSALGAETRTLNVEFAFSAPAGSDRQVKGYKLYQEGVEVCQTDNAAATMITCDILTELGVFNFTLTALYSDNSESLPSAEFPIDIGPVGITPPLVVEPLQAVISQTSKTGEIPYSVHFNGTNSTGDISEYSWDFGDGSIDEGSVTSHTYTATGEYKIRLTVTDSAGNTHQTYTSISALPNTTSPESPSAVLSSSAAVGNAPLIVSFDGSASSTPNPPIVKYQWKFGDGHAAKGEKVTHAFKTAGTYYTQLTITDSRGMLHTVDTPIIVIGAGSENIKPVAVIKADPPIGKSPLTVSFDGSKSSDPNGSVTQYHWNFGDGVTATGPNVKHTFMNEATYTVTLTITDNQGSTDTATTPIVCDPKQLIDAINVEVGQVDINHEWIKVLFENSFNEPVVVAGPPTANAYDPAIVRVRNIDKEGFEIRLQEWDYLNGSHKYETISYIVMDKGTYTLPNGNKVEANTFTGSTSFEQIPLKQPYGLSPILLTQVISENDTNAVTGRLTNITSDSFDFKLQEMEANSNAQASETIGYIAWESGSGDFSGLHYETGNTDQTITDQYFRLPYQTDFTGQTLFFATIQTFAADDTAAIRVRNQSATDIELRIEEEKSEDLERIHPEGESVGYLIFGNSQ